MSKKILIIVFIIFLGFLSGCEKEKLESGFFKEIKEIPNYDEYDETFWIGGWNDPKITLLNYQNAKAMGLNKMFVWRGKTEAQLDNLFNYASQTGIEIIYTVEGNYLNELSEKDALLKYKDSDVLFGINVFDEPKGEKVPELYSIGKSYDEFNSIKYVNLYPSTVGKENTGYRDYEDYARAVVENFIIKQDGLKVISQDLYPLKGTPTNPKIVPVWLQDMEILTKLSIEYDLFTHFFILTTKHYDYRRTSVETLRYQINVFLAHGAKGLTHFTYAHDGDGRFDVAITYFDGRKTEKYEMAKTVNHELLAWDHVYLQFDIIENMYVLGEGHSSNPCFELTKYDVETFDYIKEIYTTEDAVLGNFKDKDGNHAFMITNFADPDLKKTNYIEIDLGNANMALIYINGVKKMVDLNNGILKLELKPSEGAFVIPFNLKK
jgi:hypothetical protein